MARHSLLRKVVVGILVLGAVAYSSSAPIQGQALPLASRIPASMAVSAGLAAAANYAITAHSRWQDYEDVVVLAVLNELTKAAAAAGETPTAARYASVAGLVGHYLDTKRPANPRFADEAACLRYAINGLVPLVKSSDTDPLLRSAIARLEHLKFSRLELPLNPSRETPSDPATYTAAGSAFSFIADQVQEAADLAHSDPVFATAANPVLIELTGFDSTASYSQLKATYGDAIPTLPAPNADGSFTISLTPLLAQYQAVMADVAATTDIHLASIRGVGTEAPTGAFADPAPGGPSAAIESPALSTTPCVKTTPAGPDSVVVTAQECTKTPDKPDYWQKAQAGITGLSKVAGFLDADAGRQISTIGGAVIDAGKAIAQIDHIVSAGSVFSSLTPVLGLLGAGGPVPALIGAGFTIFKALSGSGASPNPNAQVLQAIQRLSQQIAQLHEDMTNRFDQVDAKLNTIFATLNTNFALINYQLGVINGDVRAVQAGLLDVQAQLHQMQRYTLAYMQAQSKSTVISQLNGCLNYSGVHNGEDIGAVQYNGCENTFYTWAHNNALDQLWAGLQQPNYTDGNMFSMLSELPLSVNVNYLTQLPGQNLGLPALSSVRLANPNEWMLGSRAYLELAHDWPGYAGRINGLRLDDLIQMGANLQQAVQRANSRPSGTALSANQSLFAALAAKYTAAVASLRGAIDGVVQSYRNDPANRLQNVDLWAGASQSNAYSPAALAGSLPLCGGGRTYGLPPGLGTLIGSLPRLAEQLGLGSLNLCLEYSSVPAFSGSTIQKFDTYTIRGSLGDKTVFAHKMQVLEYVGLGPCGIDQSWDAILPPCNLTTGLISLSEHVVLSRVPLGTVSANLGGGACWQLDPATYAGSSAPPTPTFQQLINERYYACRGITTIGLSLKLSSLKSIFTTAAEPLDVQAGLTALEQSVNARLRLHQQTLYGQIVRAMSMSGAVQSAGQILTGATLAWQAYVNFGLPTSLRSNDALRALLEGDMSVYDAPTIATDFQAFSSSPVPAVTDNKIAAEFAAISARAASLSSAITDVLHQIEETQQPDSAADVDLMLDDLQAFKTLKETSALAPCMYRPSSNGQRAAGLGGTTVVAVQTAAGCDFSPKTQTPWLHVVATPAGPGQFQAAIAIDANTTQSVRAGEAMMGDQLYRVVQEPGTAVAPTVRAPKNIAVLSSAPAVFTTEASGIPFPTVRWQISRDAAGTWTDLADATPFSGVTMPTLTVSPATPDLRGSRYRVVATNGVGPAVTSSAATLTVNEMPAITQQPASQTVTTPGTATFTVGVSGSPAPTVAWQASSNGGVSWNDLPNAAPSSGVGTTTLTVTTAAGLSGQQYRALASNRVGTVLSAAATLTVQGPPTVQCDGLMAVQVVGVSGTFRCVVTGTPTPTLQWQMWTTAGAAWSALSEATPYGGVTTPALTLAPISPAMRNARYRLVATNSAGTSVGDPLTLPAENRYGPELIQNGTFSAGMAGWMTWEPPDMVHNGGADGVFQWYEAAPTTASGQATVFQQTGTAVLPGTVLVATFELGNSSAVRKRVSVLVHDGAFNDQAVCTFWLAPNSPLRTYETRTHASVAWPNTSIYFYAATAGSEGGYYRLDNVSLRTDASGASTRTDCVDPTAPTPAAGAGAGGASANLLTNGDFSNGSASWGPFNDLTYGVHAGVFEFLRPGTPGLAAGGVLQSTGQALAAQQILTASFQLGNSSAVRKRVTVLLHDLDFSDLSACTFWLPAGQPLTGYTMRSFTTKPWTNATLSVYSATTGLESWTRLDNVVFQRTPATTIVGTECVEFDGNAPAVETNPLYQTAPRASPSSSGASLAAATLMQSAGGTGWRADAHVPGRAVLLWAEPIDLTDATSARLQFLSWLTPGASSAEVQVSGDGDTWEALTVVPASDGWSLVEADLAAHVGHRIYLRLVFDAVAPALGVEPGSWRIDEVQIQIELLSCIR